MGLVETWRGVKPSITGIVRQTAGERPNEYKMVALGTGVCVHEKGLVVTAKHTIANHFRRNSIDVDLDKGPTSEIPEDLFCVFVGEPDQTGSCYSLQARPIKMSFSIEKDMAFLILPPVTKYPSIKLPEYKTPIFEGQDIAAAGFPLRSMLYPSMHANLFRGIISMLHPDDIICDINLHRGNSGGPLFHCETGELLAIAYEYRQTKVKGVLVNEGKEISFLAPTNIVHGIPYNHVKLGVELFEDGKL